MDPDACLQRLDDAMNDEDFEGIASSCSDLQEWIRKGGFPPEPDDKRRYFSKDCWGWYLGSIRRVANMADRRITNLIAEKRE